MRNTTAAVGAAIALFFTVACGDGASTSVPTAEGAPLAEAATPTPDTATVSQWASLVAPYAREWHDLVDTVEEDCRRPATVVVCHLGYMNLSLRADIIATTLTGVISVPGHPDYLGEPPAEISRLVERTIEAAEGVEPAHGAYSATGCRDPYADECRAEASAMRSAVRELTAAYDAWAPYLGSRR
jgi:hypothetical protein